MIARVRKLGTVLLFGIAMFSLGSIYTAFLMVMGEQFIRQMSGGVL